MTINKLFRITSVLALAASLFVLPGCGDTSDDFDIPDTGMNVPPPSNQPNIPLNAYLDSYEGEQDVILYVDDLFGVLANDEYPIYDTVIEYPLGTVQGGDLEGYQSGAFEYEPPAGFTGQDSFTYTLRDEFGRTSEAEVFIQVYPPGFRTTQDV